MSELAIAIVSGGIGLVGGLAGSVFSARTARESERRRIAVEDERRWLTDRRTAYSVYLSRVQSLLRQLDAAAAFLKYDDPGAPPASDNEACADFLMAFFIDWDDGLQPSLGEVQLLASPEVSDLADRVSGGLMECSSPIEGRDAFTQFYPIWFQVCDLRDVLRNAMRKELGLPAGLESTSRRSEDWPWLPNRPSRETYRQGHGRHDQRAL